MWCPQCGVHFQEVISFIFKLNNIQDILVRPDEDEYDLLIKKIQHLVEVGNGETIFEIGAGEGKKLLI